MSYQYRSYLYYWEIHLCMYICYFCPLIYDYSVIFIMFDIKLPQNLFLTNIESISLWYFWTQLFCSRQNNPQTIIFDHTYHWFLLCKLSDPWNTEHYRGSLYHCEEYLELHIGYKKPQQNELVTKNAFKFEYRKLKKYTF